MCYQHTLGILLLEKDRAGQSPHLGRLVSSPPRRNDQPAAVFLSFYSPILLCLGPHKAPFHSTPLPGLSPSPFNLKPPPNPGQLFWPHCLLGRRVPEWGRGGLFTLALCPGLKESDKGSTLNRMLTLPMNWDREKSLVVTSLPQDGVCPTPFSGRCCSSCRLGSSLLCQEIGDSKGSFGPEIWETILAF